MARVYGIKKRLTNYGFDEKAIKEIIGNGDLVDIIKRMEKLLDPDLTREILDSCACGGGKEYIKKCEQTGRELAGKELTEKINHLNSAPDSTMLTLNRDNTITGVMSFGDSGRYKCVCSAAVKNGVTVADLASAEDENRVMPLTYCLCCAGSWRRHLQLQLGIGLKTREIISSPINSRGEKPCEFIFEIVDTGKVKG